MPLYYHGIRNNAITGKVTPHRSSIFDRENLEKTQGKILASRVARKTEEFFPALFQGFG
jgi:hypothetical protein